MLPTGTGNLLARNLGIPRQVPDAMDVAMTGHDRRLRSRSRWRGVFLSFRACGRH